MANPFYTYSGAFIPGTLARAEQVGTEYTSVQAGFAILAIQGTDSGSANTYVVATNGGPSGAYADGNIVEFKAAAANTGASTINVNGIGVVGLTNSIGQSLAGGAISAGTWYRALYNSTYSAFTIIAPTSLVTTSNTISTAPPTHLVGLTPAGGSSTACAPIDVTFAIDQSIVPIWTGAHTFASTVAFNSTVTFAGGLSVTGPTANLFAMLVTANATSGQSYGLKVAGGTNASDQAFSVTNQAASVAFFKIDGTGGATVGTPTGGSQGLGTINATGLFVNGAAVKTTSVSSANPSASVGLSAVNGTAVTFMTSDSAPALSQSITPTWTAAHTFTPSSAVTAVTINAAVNAIGAALVGGTNTVNTYLLTLATGQGSGFSSGLAVSAGTTSGDSALLVRNAATSTIFFEVFGDGEIMFTPPTSASQQATNFYQVGMMDIPLHTTNTPVFQDRGKFINATNNVTIAANSSVAWPIGTTMLIFADAGSPITITVTTDTLLWIPSGTTGVRTLAINSLATIYKFSATEWLIWGFGLT